MSVGDLTVSEHARHVGISYRHIVTQELVALSRSQSRENSARGLDPDRARQHLRVRRDAHETALGERAGSPPVLTVFANQLRMARWCTCESQASATSAFTSR